MNESPAIILLIVATCGISFFAFDRPDVEDRYIFRPERILASKEYYRLVSSAFLHSGWAHLLLNMYTLYSFGGVIAWAFGQWNFLLIYFGSIVGGNLLSLYLHRNHDYAAYGASGGVCGIIFAYVLRFPHSRMALFPLPYAVPAWLYAIAFAIGSFYALKSQNDNIGHDAHLGGAMVGLLLAADLHPDLVRQHWVVFTTLLLVSGLLLSYLFGNPLFLPLSAVLSIPSWSPRRRVPPRLRPPKRVLPARQAPAARERTVRSPACESDWLIEEIEKHVGPLRKDENNLHGWIDKFGRTYDVITGAPDSFDLASFRKTVLDRLENPKVRFVIIDTRRLQEGQAALLRPFFANLADSQFNRILRSSEFKPRRVD